MDINQLPPKLVLWIGGLEGKRSFPVTLYKNQGFKSPNHQFKHKAKGSLKKSLAAVDPPAKVSNCLRVSWNTPLNSTKKLKSKNPTQLQFRAIKRWTVCAGVFRMAPLSGWETTR